MAANGHMTGSRASSVSTLAISAAIVVLLVVLFPRLGNPSGVLPSASPSATEQMSALPSGTPAVTSTASAAPAASPDASVAGDAPAPDATVPPDVATLPNLRIQAVSNLATSFGLTCRSRSGGIAGTDGGFNLHCDGTIGDPSADVAVNAVYWTNGDGIETLDISFIPSSVDQSLDTTTAASRWILPVAGVAGATAVAWVQSRVGDTSCTSGCAFAIPGGFLTYTSGVRGAQQLTLVAGTSP